MVNVTTAAGPQSFYIPTNGILPEDAPALEVTSTHDAGAPLPVPVLAWAVLGAYVRISAQMPEGFHEGEWQYALTADDVLISSGLLIAGDPAPVEVVEYNREIEYREYGND